MNKQRKVLITITYNEMGIIIDTKAEEVAQPNLQPTCNQLATDCISRQAAIDAVEHITSTMSVCVNTDECHGMKRMQRQAVIELTNLPSAQPLVIHCTDCDDWLERQSILGFAISKLPSAQPEPDIIACGDCKHWICHDKRCGYWNHGVKPLDWCCYAERRTDEQTD